MQTGASTDKLEEGLGLETKPKGPKESIAIHWFRKGLRIFDNPALRYVLKQSLDSKKYGKQLTVLPLYIMDPTYVNPNKVGVNKMNFILETLKDLNKNLKDKLGLNLKIAKGKPVSIFKKLIKVFNIRFLSYEAEQVEPYGVNRDEEVLSTFAENREEHQDLENL